MKLKTLLKSLGQNEQVLGGSILNERGEIIENTLPFSSERIDGIVRPVYKMLVECKKQGRKGNRFIIRSGENCLICESLELETVFVLMKGSKDLDSVLNSIKYLSETQETDEKTPVGYLPFSGKDTQRNLIGRAKKNGQAAQPSHRQEPVSAVSSHSPSHLNTEGFSAKLVKALGAIALVGIISAAALHLVAKNVEPTATLDEPAPIPRDLAPTDASVEKEAVQPKAPIRTTPPAIANTLSGRKLIPPFRIHCPTNIADKFIPALIEEFIKSQGFSISEIKQNPNERVFNFYNDSSEGAIKLMAVSSFPSYSPSDIDKHMRQPGRGDRQTKMLVTAYPLSQGLDYNIHKVGLELNDKSTEFAIARDALAVIVHPSNPLTEITLDELTLILSGGIINWAVFDQDMRPIKRYGLRKKSHVFTLIDDFISSPRGTTRHFTELMDDSVAVYDAVMADPKAIAVVAANSLPPSCRTLKIIKDSEGLPKELSKQAVKNMEYPLTFQIYLQSPADRSELEQALVDFARSEGAASVIESFGFVSTYGVSPSKLSADQTPLTKLREEYLNSLTQEFKTLHESATRNDFRKVLLYEPTKQIINPFMPEIRQNIRKDQKVVIVGRSNSRRSGIAHAQHAAEQLASQLRSSGYSDVSIISLGNAMPVSRRGSKVANSLNNHLQIWTQPTAPGL